MYKICPHPPSTDRETNNYQKQFETRGRPVKQSRFRFTRHLTRKMVGRTITRRTLNPTVPTHTILYYWTFLSIKLYVILFINNLMSLLGLEILCIKQ